MCSHMKGVEVEHQSEGTDGSLISKLGMEMINASEQLHHMRAQQTSSMSIDVYEHVWRGCVLWGPLLLSKSCINASRHVAASPSMQMTSAWSFSVLSICIEKKKPLSHLCVCSFSGFSPAGSVNEWQTETGSRGSVNNKLIKTHNRHQRQRVEEKHGGEEERRSESTGE